MLQLIWATVLLTAALWKISTSGFHSYIEHFTNWAWTIEFIFYYLTFPSALVVGFKDRGWLRSLVVWSIAILLPVVWGIAWLVLLLVGLLLLTGAAFLQTILAALPLSIVIVGNEVYHLVPVIAILVYIAIHHKLVFYSLNQLFTRPAALEYAGIRYGLLIYAAGGGVAVVALLYRAFHDPKVVYQSNLDEWLGVLFAFGVLALFSLTPLLVGMAYFDLFTYRRSPRWLEHGEYEDDDEGSDADE